MISLALIALVVGQCGSDCCCPPCGGLQLTKRSHLRESWDYYDRVYSGWYQTYPYDYRTVFDYPWHSGPSQMHWPLATLPPHPAPWLQGPGQQFPPAPPPDIAPPATGNVRLNRPGQPVLRIVP